MVMDDHGGMDTIDLNITVDAGGGAPSPAPRALAEAAPQAAADHDGQVPIPEEASAEMAAPLSALSALCVSGFIPDASAINDPVVDEVKALLQLAGDMQADMVQAVPGSGISLAEGCAAFDALHATAPEQDAGLLALQVALQNG